MADPSVQRGAAHTHRRSWPWVAAAVVFCPCHLPLTLGLVAGAFGGSLLRNGWVYAAIALVFGIALWRAISVERQRSACAACQREG